MEIDRWIQAPLAVMQMLNQSVVVKREAGQKAKLSIYQSTDVQTLISGHKLSVMTERKQESGIQAAKMSFLPWVAGLTLIVRVRSSVKTRCFSASSEAN